MATLKQWVNIHPFYRGVPKHEGVEIPEERLGPVTPKMTFKNKGAGLAQIRVVHEEGNIPYSQGVDPSNYVSFEAERNQYYRLRAAGTVLKQDGTTDFIPADLEVNLPAAGGNRYRFEGKDAKGNVVKSEHEVEVHRYLQYQVFMSKDTGHKTVERINFALRALEKRFLDEKANIHLARIDKRGNVNQDLIYLVVPVEGPGRDNFQTVDGDVASAARLPIHSAGVAIAFVNDLSVRFERKLLKVPIMLGRRGPANTSGPGWSFDSRQGIFEVRLPEQMGFLWHGLPGVGDQEFLDSFEVTWNTGERMSCNPLDAHVEGAPERTYGGHRRFSIHLREREKIERHFDIPGTLDMKVNTVISINGRCGSPNVIMVATRADFEPRSKEQLAITLLHEMGHRIGLAANGDLDWLNFYKKHTPDSSDYYYDDQTDKSMRHHRGNHCKFPNVAGGKIRRKKPPEATQEPTCIMYGQNVSSRQTFCPKCSEALRKLDLTDITR